jgi:SAM-dependent methyltransferase
MTGSIPGSTWKDAILRQDPALRLEAGLAVTSESEPEGESAYWDIDYESILQDPYRTVTAEFPSYMVAIAEAYGLAARAAAGGPLVADLGCGDGRFTRKLLELGCPRVVALDVSRKNLARLRPRIEATGGVDRVLLIQGDVSSPRLPPASFDLVLLAGVLCVFAQEAAYRRALRACRDLVRPGGYLLVFDPIDLGSVMYALVRHHLPELRTVVTEGTKSVDIADPEAPRVAVRSLPAMLAAHESAGVEVQKVSGIPLFPSLLFGGVKQRIAATPDDLELLKELNDTLCARYTNLWRAACILSRRPAG